MNPTLPQRIKVLCGSVGSIPTRLPRVGTKGVLVQFQDDMSHANGMSNSGETNGTGG